MCVFLNKIDEVNDPETRELVEMEVRELLNEFGFPGDTAPVKTIITLCLTIVRKKIIYSFWVLILLLSHIRSSLVLLFVLCKEPNRRLARNPSFSCWTRLTTILKFPNVTSPMNHIWRQNMFTQSKVEKENDERIVKHFEGRGTVITGKLEDGSLKKNEKVTIVGCGKEVNSVIAGAWN